LSTVQCALPHATGTEGDPQTRRFPMTSASAHFAPVPHVASVSQSSKRQSLASLHPTSGSALANPMQHRCDAAQSLVLLHCVGVAAADADGGADATGGAATEDDAEVGGITTGCGVLAPTPDCGAVLWHATADTRRTEATTTSVLRMRASIGVAWSV
jgi:hypothetical protein